MQPGPYTAVPHTGPSPAPRPNWVAVGLVIFMAVVLVTGAVTIVLISRPEPVMPAPGGLPAPRTVKIGQIPGGLTTSSDGTRLFVSQYKSIAIVDPVTGEKRGEIPFAASTPYGLAPSPDGRTLYAGASGKIERIELGGNLIGDPISAPGLSGPVAISPNGRWLLRTSDGPNTDRATGTVSVIDLSSGTLAGNVPLPGLGSPATLEISPDGTRAYLAGDSRYPRAEKDVSVFSVDLATRVATPIPLPTKPDAHYHTTGADLALSPDGRELYVHTGEDISVLDTATNAVKRTFPKPLSVRTMLVSPSGRYLISYEYSSGKVYVLDSADGHVVARGRGVKNPRGVGLSPDGRRLYFTAGGDYDLESHEYTNGQLVIVELGELR